jgi:phosphatidylglycerol---prolipoprotein diacylglyceryl transferase
MDPVIFNLGPLSLTWYGVFIVGGAVLATWIASVYARRDGQSPDHAWNLLAFALIFGIIGARLYHVFSSPADGLGWAHYREHPLEIINFWNGGFRGLGIYGGLAGGVLAFWGYCTLNKLSTLRYLSYFAPNVLLAQAFGRLGNWVNQELYGPPTNLPWAFHINPAHPCQLPMNMPEGIQACGTGAFVPFTQQTLDWYASNGFHPTFFYEALWNVAMFALLTLLVRYAGHRMRVGDPVFLYFIAYSVGRLWVEALRPDAWVMGRLATAQWIAIGLIILNVIILYLRHRNWSATANPEDTLARLSVHPPPPATEPLPA